ncbi:MAG: Beta/Gamma crystallin [Pseudonocardiales bacterium]|nr:Beta/Gamma crystallin [Pseudonocardiales bacterium]
MRLGKSLAVIGLATAATLGMAAPAFAINTAPCRGNGETSLGYRILTDRVYECFVNAGSMNVNISGIDFLGGGNNDGNIEFIDTDGTPRWRPFERGQKYNFPAVRVTKITIYAR